ncbi:uncharacterized protein LOC129136176 [Pan troglodytes]|uniref:uncharacterized protein LOC129136176 n=1 Tax=Pan troglodytes TaxID=9598 RepID=UPI0023F15A2E|nr:uncharacterized protein LOC129136176 [Pan troglodytes]
MKSVDLQAGAAEGGGEVENAGLGLDSGAGVVWSPRALNPEGSGLTSAPKLRVAHGGSGPWKFRTPQQFRAVIAFPKPGSPGPRQVSPRCDLRRAERRAPSSLLGVGGRAENRDVSAVRPTPAVQSCCLPGLLQPGLSRPPKLPGFRPPLLPALWGGGGWTQADAPRWAGYLGRGPASRTPSRAPVRKKRKFRPGAQGSEMRRPPHPPKFLPAVLALTSWKLASPWVFPSVTRGCGSNFNSFVKQKDQPFPTFGGGGGLFLIFVKGMLVVGVPGAFYEAALPFHPHRCRGGCGVNGKYSGWDTPLLAESQDAVFEFVLDEDVQRLHSSALTQIIPERVRRWELQPDPQGHRHGRFCKSPPGRPCFLAADVKYWTKAAAPCQGFPLSKAVSTPAFYLLNVDNASTIMATKNVFRHGQLSSVEPNHSHGELLR